MLKKTSLLLTILIFTTSCNLLMEPMPKSWKWGLKPRPLTGMRGFLGADTNYGKGFKDGCGAGWDSVAKGLLSDINAKKYDPKLAVRGPDYNNGWWDGFEQCTYIIEEMVV